MERFVGGQNLTHQVAHELGAAIVRGVYKVGDAFPSEAALCERYDISRSVIREAVKMLSAKGLLSSRPRQGIRVLPHTEWNLFDPDVLQWTLAGKPSLELLREFTELRIGIEPEAAILAARRRHPDKLRAVEAALLRMRQAELGDDDPLGADTAFHTAILVASENRFFVRLRSFIQTALRVSIAITNQLKGVSIASHEEHKRVYDAIARGDAQGAHDAMLSLLTEVLALIDRSRVSEEAS
jgi:DNA-binding FadR family transcriptional regulator